nr:NTP transferase domain-containing protein [Streptomyces sp. SID7803]
MIGLVLAAGAGRRLRPPYTDTLPKALVPVDGDKTVLDLTLANFAEIGLTEVAIVVGYRKEAVYDRKEELEATYGLKLTLVDNDKAEEWNNAYSLWCAREVLKRGVILA